MEHQASRRDLLMTSLMAALPLGVTGAAASPLNPEQTIIKPPDSLQWKTLPPFPPGKRRYLSANRGRPPRPGPLLYARALAFGIYERPALLFDRSLLHGPVGDLVVQQRSADFDPAACVPVPAGSYVRRVALTPHYDGVIRSHNEAVVIAICVIGPVNFTLNDPSKPPWREV